MTAATAALDAGIRAQMRTLQRRLDAGMPRTGWKICINDPRVQRKLGIDASLVGFLDRSRSPSAGESWCVEAGAVLGVEPEFAVHFCEPVAAGDGAARIREAIAGVAPAIEVLDWSAAKFDLESLVASSSFHAGFIVGELRPLSDVPSLADGWPRFRRAHEVIGAPDPDLVPSDLTKVVAHVASCLARYGQAIQKADWLLCGACTNPARVEAGDEIEADFGPLGVVRTSFTEGSTAPR